MKTIQAILVRAALIGLLLVRPLLGEIKPGTYQLARTVPLEILEGTKIVGKMDLSSGDTIQLVSVNGDKGLIHFGRNVAGNISLVPEEGLFVPEEKSQGKAAEGTKANDQTALLLMLGKSHSYAQKLVALNSASQKQFKDWITNQTPDRQAKYANLGTIQPASLHGWVNARDQYLHLVNSFIQAPQMINFRVDRKIDRSNYEIRLLVYSMGRTLVTGEYGEILQSAPGGLVPAIPALLKTHKTEYTTDGNAQLSVVQVNTVTLPSSNGTPIQVPVFEESLELPLQDVVQLLDDAQLELRQWICAGKLSGADLSDLITTLETIEKPLAGEPTQSAQQRIRLESQVFYFVPLRDAYSHFDSAPRVRPAPDSFYTSTDDPFAPPAKGNGKPSPGGADGDRDPFAPFGPADK